MKTTLLQRKSTASSTAPQSMQGSQSKTNAINHNFGNIHSGKNNTGLPDRLKAGIENLSGYSLDDVKVHYNSSNPARFKANAYAKGTEIHLASGQEKHLPHEAWHVVQQKQGRVKPTVQMKGNIAVNDDQSLEKEADVMGAKALQLKNSGHSLQSANKPAHKGLNNSQMPLQGAWNQKEGTFSCDPEVVKREKAEGKYTPESAGKPLTLGADGSVSLPGEELKSGRVQYAYTKKGLVGKYFPKGGDQPHTALVDGEDVFCAGWIELKNNDKVWTVDNSSGHYKPNETGFQKLLEDHPHFKHASGFHCTFRDGEIGRFPSKAAFSRKKQEKDDARAQAAAEKKAAAEKAAAEKAAASTTESKAKAAPAAAASSGEPRLGGGLEALQDTSVLSASAAAASLAASRRSATPPARRVASGLSRRSEGLEANLGVPASSVSASAMASLAASRRSGTPSASQRIPMPAAPAAAASSATSRRSATPPARRVAPASASVPSASAAAAASSATPRRVVPSGPTGGVTGSSQQEKSDLIKKIKAKVGDITLSGRGTESRDVYKWEGRMRTIKWASPKELKEWCKELGIE